MIRKIRFYSFLFLLIMGNVFLLKSQPISSSNQLDRNFSEHTCPPLSNLDDYQFAQLPLCQNDYPSSTSFSALSENNAIVLYAPPSEGGNPIGIPARDNFWIVTALAIIYGIYGIYKMNKAKKN